MSNATGTLPMAIVHLKGPPGTASHCNSVLKPPFGPDPCKAGVVWMGGWVDGWMDGWMDACMHGWMHAWMDGWMSNGNRPLPRQGSLRYTLHTSSHERAKGAQTKQLWEPQLQARGASSASAIPPFHPAPYRPYKLREQVVF